MQNITKQDMDVLVRLQKSETEIVRIESLLVKIEQEKSKLGSKLTEFENALARHKDDLQRIGTNCRETEAEIQMLGERIVNSREKVRHVRTNKEYQSLQREIDDSGKKKEQLENSFFEQLEEKEAKETLVEDRIAEFKLLKQKIESDQDEIEKRCQNDRRLLEEYKNQREDTGKNLKPQLFQKFIEISGTSGGKAVVPVENAVCRGCFMNIPPQLYIEAQRGNSLILCPQCNRILYYAAGVEIEEDTVGPD